MARALVKGDVEAVPQSEPNRTAQGLGPRAAIRHAGFEKMSEQERMKWVGQARLDAILGGCRLSLQSWKSGMRCYIVFAGEPVTVGARHVSLLLCPQTPSARSARNTSLQSWKSC